MVPTFRIAFEEAYRTLGADWAISTAKAFRTSLERHALPELGTVPVNAIGQADLVALLAPIWTSKPLMARKVCNLTLQVLAFAQLRGWRTEVVPTPGELRQQLAAQPQPRRFASVPYPEVPEFFGSELRKAAPPGRFAILFSILTAARSGEVRRATWEQVDLASGIWRRSAADMKMTVDHSVKLPFAALQLLQRWQPLAELRKGLIFPGANGGRLSDMTLSMTMRSAHQAACDAGLKGYCDPISGKVATVHGFRGSFCSWVIAERPNSPALVLEMALGNKVGTRTEAIYQRPDLQAKRDQLLELWAQFVSPELSGVTPDRDIADRPNPAAGPA